MHIGITNDIDGTPSRKNNTRSSFSRVARIGCIRGFVFPYSVVLQIIAKNKKHFFQIVFD